MTIGLLSLLAVLVLAFLRVPLAFALLSVSLAGISVVMGFDVARSLVPLTLAIILICVPLFLPLLMSHGFDLIWFGIIVVVVTEIALITPPIGMNVFVLKAALPHVRLGAIFRGLFPFVGIDLLRLLLLVAFPSITLGLVAMMK